MAGRLILTLSAATLFILGITALFAPQEVARSLDPSASSSLPVVIQLIGASLLGFALLNWMSRRNRIGGIYARPIGVGNLMFFTTAALTLGKAASNLPIVLLATGALFAVLAASFAWLVFAHDPVSDAAAK
jgi:ABC-type molybdate transport system permease subunit